MSYMGVSLKVPIYYSGHSRLLGFTLLWGFYRDHEAHNPFKPYIMPHL